MNAGLKSLTLNLTEECNLHCRHCGSMKNNYSGIAALKNELKYEDYIAVLDMAAALNTRHIVFSGGEPFLNKNIFDLLRHADGLNLKYTILTNGTLLNETAIRKLKNLRNLLFIRVSLDYASNSSVFEFRGIRNGYSKTLRLIRNLTDYNIRTGVGMTLMLDNLGELDKLVCVCAKLGAEFFRAVPVLPIGNAVEFNTDTGFYTECIKKILDIKKKFENLKYLPVEDGIKNGNENRIIRSLFAGCNGGSEKVVVTAYGNLNYCPLALYDDRDGTLNNGNWQSLLKNAENKKNADIKKAAELPGDCRDCNYLENCGGGCIAEITSRNFEDGQVLCIKKIVSKILDEDDDGNYLQMLSRVARHVEFLKSKNLFTPCYRSLPVWTVYLN